MNPRPSESGSLLTSVLWLRIDEPGAEHFRLWRTPDGYRLEGTVAAALEHGPLSVEYEVICSADWLTRAVHVELRTAAGLRNTCIDADLDRRWYLDGHHLQPLDGLTDIDLAITPATNTLPIRRLALEPGESRDVIAAWLRFPELTLKTLTQRYTRRNDSTYDYESEGGFHAELEVDGYGVIVRYEGLWERKG